MSGTRWNRLVALYVGDDLDDRRGDDVERHLAVCPSCRRLEQELRSDMLNLRELDSAATGDLGLGSVRGAVMARIENRRRPFAAPTMPRLLAVCATAVAVIALALLFRQGRERDAHQTAGGEAAIPASVVAAEPEPRVPSPPQVPAAIVRETTITAGIPSAPAAQSPLRQALPSPPSVPAEPMTLKILTDDPEVVIYWIVDPKGDMEDVSKDLRSSVRSRPGGHSGHRPGDRDSREPGASCNQGGVGDPDLPGRVRRRA
jgi:hypothetical protein